MYAGIGVGAAGADFGVTGLTRGATLAGATLIGAGAVTAVAGIAR
jgi:hypothetical protein